MIDHLSASETGGTTQYENDAVGEWAADGIGWTTDTDTREPVLVLVHAVLDRHHRPTLSLKMTVLASPRFTNDFSTTIFLSLASMSIAHNIEESLWYDTYYPVA